MKRVLALIITSPVWLTAVVLMSFVCIPVWIALGIVRLIMYGFNGEWE
ncbi:MAG: hypothetical protein MUO31_06850 [Thermodesulfovibrionales bacterium]|nr:hypothetical protein [Thermodesulfovibrionales bacterium]